MPAGQLTITVEQNTDFSQIFTIQDNTGNPIDITGESYAAQIRPTYNSPTLTAAFTFTVLDQSTNRGQVQMTLAKSISSGIVLPVGSQFVDQYYTVQRTFTDGHTERMLEGKCRISAEVTA